MRNVTFEHISFSALDGIRVETAYDKKNPAANPTVIENIRYSHLSGYAGRDGRLLCSTLIPCHNLHFDDVRVTGALGYKCAGNITGTETGCSPKISCLH